MKHVLLVGGFLPAHKQLKELGARLTLLIEADTIFRMQQSESFYARSMGIPKSASLEEWVNIAAVIHRFDPIDAIGAYHEFNQEKASLMAGALGLPFHTLETIQAVRHKDQMRERLRAAGVDGPVRKTDQTFPLTRRAGILPADGNCLGAMTC